ncbi:uncharacterized protein V1518DRAFT_405677 [Limtongia smithiae]|uniref:uncharacterized protein n=1 Tax=Limtongia smithiae TaxID=1125753 RepID=UPI0034CFD8F4
MQVNLTAEEQDEFLKRLRQIIDGLLGTTARRLPQVEELDVEESDAKDSSSSVHVVKEEDAASALPAALREHMAVTILDLIWHAEEFGMSKLELADIFREELERSN